MNGQLVLGNWHNDTIKRASIVPDLAQVGPNLSLICSNFAQGDPKLTKFAWMWTQISLNYFKLAQGAPKFAQVGPKLAQGVPKLALSWPKVSSIWSKVGSSSPNLAPSW